MADAKIDLAQWMRACVGGDAATARQALERGFPIDAVEDGFTGLMQAAKRGHLEVLELLLGAGADPNLTYHGAPGAISALSLALGASGMPADMRSERQRSCARLLMPPTTDPLRASRPCDEAFRISAPSGESPWGAEHAELALALAGSSPEGAMEPDFREAAKARDWARMQRSLDAGMHVDARYEGFTMLHVAALQGDHEMASWLMDRGAGLERKLAAEGGLTPLMLCVKGRVACVPGMASPTKEQAAGRLKVMAGLIAKGADVEARAPNGSTALMFSCMLGDGKCVDILLAAGADPRVKMSLGAGLVDAAGAAALLCHGSLAARLREFALVVEERAQLLEASKAAAPGPASRAAPSL